LKKKTTAKKKTPLDLRRVLDGWEFNPGNVTVRQIIGDDGEPKVQLRLDLGLLQMELDGRPDGQHPHGLESHFEHFQTLAAKKPGDFLLREEDCATLQQEAVQYYHRYLALFHLEDWTRVIRDTSRNLALFDFVEEHTDDPSLSHMFQQFSPYVLMMRARAKANLALSRQQALEALREAEGGVEAIRDFFEQRGHAEMAEQSQEIHFLENWIKELRASKPLSERDRLERALAEAIEQENYEKAATLRDTLRALNV
jgi:hypothetical protein